MLSKIITHCYYVIVMYYSILYYIIINNIFIFLCGLYTPIMPFRVMNFSSLPFRWTFFFFKWKSEILCLRFCIQISFAKVHRTAMLMHHIHFNFAKHIEHIHCYWVMKHWKDRVLQFNISETSILDINTCFHNIACWSMLKNTTLTFMQLLWSLVFSNLKGFISTVFLYVSFYHTFYFYI